MTVTDADPRGLALAGFLAAAAPGATEPMALAGDASNRRYLRLRLASGAPAVLMDAPVERGEDIRPFMAITHWLRERGFSAPRILSADAAEGFLLLEDLGDALFARVAEVEPGLEAPMYEAAVDLLADLARHPAPQAMGEMALAPYDAAVLRREALLATEWWLPAATGEARSAEAGAELAALVAEATAEAEAARGAVVLRDYHAENLIWLPERAGVARVGLLDYQDALAGHPAYDLVSLLEDARRDTAPELREAMLARRVAGAGLGRGAAEDFRRAYAALGAQRNLKIVGIFARLAIRDGKARYLAMIPRVWGHLERDLAHPALAPLRDWVRRHLPAPEPAALARASAAATGDA